MSTLQARIEAARTTKGFNQLNRAARRALVYGPGKRIRSRTLRKRT